MKILLVAVNAKYIHSNPAVHSLKAYAGEYEDCVEIAEFTINQQPSYIMREIYRKRPDVIAFSCYIWNRGVMDAVLPDLHKLLPHADFWAGGPEVSHDASGAIGRWRLRGVITGPGETAFARLAAAYGTGTAEELPAVLDGNRMRPKLDQLPFWYENMEDFTHRIIYYESSRGCPFSCSYCLSSIDRSMDFRSVDRVCRELDFFLDKKVPQVKFVDRTFNCRKEHALPILRHILAHDNGETNFHFEIAADLLDEDYFAVMEKLRPGAVQLEIGVQSTCPETIEEIHRRMDFHKVAAVVRRISSWRNIHIHLDLIAGLPFEDLQRFRISFDDVYSLRPQQLQLGFLKVLKGSDMERLAPGYDLIYADQPPYEVLSTRWLSYEDLCRLKQIEETVELYYNSGQFAHTLEFMLSRFHGPYAMYESLAAWFDRHALFGVQSSRIRKYEILLEWGIACILGEPQTPPLSGQADTERHTGVSRQTDTSEQADTDGQARTGGQAGASEQTGTDGQTYVSGQASTGSPTGTGGQIRSDVPSIKDEADSQISRLKEVLLYDLYLREHMKNRPAFAPSQEPWKEVIHDALHRESLEHTRFPELADCNYRELTKRLHGEVFTHIFDEPTLVLFGYERRDPLTNNGITAAESLAGSIPDSATPGALPRSAPAFPEKKRR